jgi:hypothetical protein
VLSSNHKELYQAYKSVPMESLPHIQEVIAYRHLFVEHHAETLSSHLVNEGANYERHQVTNQKNSSMFNHRTKSVLVVNTIPLLKAFSSQPSFITNNRNIISMLHFINPFAINNISTSTSTNQMPRLIVLQRQKLFTHSCLPLRIRKSLMSTSRPRPSIIILGYKIPL